MCGITGYVSLAPEPLSREVGERLLSTVSHRGPDERGGFWFENAFIGNTRLSIIDLAGGSQPMLNDEGSIVVVQNGEIYNYIELKSELEHCGVRFRTDSDTEVILQAYEYFGPGFVERLNGMFAIAILDLRSRELLLFRDRLGVKPLYLWSSGRGLYFSSEIKSFLKVSGFDPTPDTGAIAGYFTFNFVPLPHTIFRDVRHLQPGSFLKIRLTTGEIVEKPWWSISNDPEVEIKEDEFIEELRELLLDATKIRMRSDVEVGMFLSGGLDSSSITALVHTGLGLRLRAFNIDLDSAGFSEREFARSVAELHAASFEVHPVGAELIELWPRTTFFADQPHGDTSFLPQYSLSEFAAKRVKVVLSGDGGDELFAGYDKYRQLLRSDLDPKERLRSYLADISVFSAGDRRDLLALNGDVVEELTPEEQFAETLTKFSNKDPVNQALCWDLLQLLPGNNLVKPDKMAMAHGLEVRCPFLDYRLHEKLLRVSGQLKIGVETPKRLLRQIVEPILGRSILDRKKETFRVPISSIFLGEKRGVVERFISRSSLEERGLIRPGQFQRIAREFLAGQETNPRKFRALMNLELWVRIFLDSDNPWSDIEGESF